MTSCPAFLQQALHKRERQFHRMLGLGIKCVPFALQQVLAKKLLNQIFAEPLADGEFAFLAGKTCLLHVSDLNLRHSFSVENNQLYLVSAEAEASVLIRGSSYAFLRLANRQEDPDTLFFQRQLEIEGDTEMGLHIKNLIDATDWQQVPMLVKKALSVAGSFEQFLQRKPS